MHELILLLGVVVACMVAATLLFGIIKPAVYVLEQILLYCSVAIILVVMLFVGAEVMMRYGFNAPIPGHLEGSELLMPIIVFLAISYAQRERAHVGMDLAIEMMPDNARRILQVTTLLISVIVCAVLAWFSGKAAYLLWLYDDVTMTPPYFKTWPAQASISAGYGLLSFRLFLQSLAGIAPDRFPDEPIEGTPEPHME
ncbi:MAG: TRAP transporter small permease [Hyphomicrobiaceae bacterium]